MKKKFYSVLIVVISFASLIGCGKDNTKEPATEKPVVKIEETADDHEEITVETAVPEMIPEDDIIAEDGDEGEAVLTVSDLFRKEERVWLLIKNTDDITKNSPVEAIYLTRPDGTLRYCFAAETVKGNCDDDYRTLGILGDFSKMNDTEIIDFMDSYINNLTFEYSRADGAEDPTEKLYFPMCYQYMTEEAGNHIKEYVLENKLKYWLMAGTDKTGNNIGGESIVIPSYPFAMDSNGRRDEGDVMQAKHHTTYEVNSGESAVYGRPDVGVIEYAPILAGGFGLSPKNVIKGDIYDSKYIGFLQDKAILITRMNPGEEYEIILDTLNTEGIIVDSDVSSVEGEKIQKVPSKEYEDSYEPYVNYLEKVPYQDYKE